MKSNPSADMMPSMYHACEESGLRVSESKMASMVSERLSF